MSVLIKGDITIEELQSAMLIFKGHEIIDLPDHGDLIDKDLLVEMCDAPHWCVWLNEIDDAPVVIPAERSEE